MKLNPNGVSANENLEAARTLRDLERDDIHPHPGLLPREKENRSPVI
jgi:hypothetical protein